MKKPSKKSIEENLEIDTASSSPEEVCAARQREPKRQNPCGDRGSGRASDGGLDAVSLLQDLQRTRADFENYRKQVELQREQAKAMAANATVLKLLPLLDDIDRAISTYPEQLGSLKKSFEKSLGELRLAKMDTEPGVDFNPDLHDAISMDDSDGPREVIAETLRPGYLYDGKVLRPAMVRVTHK